MNKDTVKLVGHFEGLRLNAYPDPATGNLPITIGYGTTRINSKPVSLGTTITKTQAEQYLADDLLRFENGVKALVKVKLSASQLGALTSLAYNIGLGNLGSSTLLTLLNKGDYAGAAAQFSRWNKANGRPMTGLTKRRKAEATFFSTGKLVLE